MNETFVFGELQANPYFIYKGGEQEDKEQKNREPHKYYHKYTEPILLEDDNKALQYYDIHYNELLHFQVQLKLLLKVLCCRFSTIYIYTGSTLKHIQEKSMNIFNDKLKNNLKPKQINPFYGGEEIGDDYDISMFSNYL